MVKVKICGITNLKDAVKACEYGADLLGFIFVEGTPRCVDAEKTKKITSELPKGVSKVGLFKDTRLESVIEAFLYSDLDSIQLHGEESPDYCRTLKDLLGQEKHIQANIMKVFKVAEEILPIGSHGIEDYKDVDYFVFDTFHPEIAGGTGAKFDWEILNKEKNRINKPFFIAGGLGPANVSETVKVVSPYGVDVSSGVEKSPGIKDEKLLKEFIENAKRA